MTYEEFNTLVDRLEGEARAHPLRYRWKMFALALLGNLYLTLVLAVAVAFFALSLLSLTIAKALALKLVIVAAVFLWMMVKALWVRLDPPQGLPVTAAEAPHLFAVIEELRRELRAPRFHHVLVTDDFNAAVVQVPLLGLFGWSRNYLLLGLPLLKALSGEQFKAVLAHEFGHLARGHGRTANWIYRQRLRWSRLLASFEANDGQGAFLFKPFLRWYTPRFNAYSFPLARANEYEADATSARLTSPRAAAEALTAVNVVGSYLGQRFWPEIHNLAADQPLPNATPFVNLSARVAAELDADASRRFLEGAMAELSSSEDTHPALKDRLAAIGEGPRLAPPPPGKAADLYLGDALARITAELDRRWQEAILPAWQERHREVQEGRRRLAELEGKAAEGGELTTQEAYDRALLTESIANNVEDALAQLRALVERIPDDPTVRYQLGVRLVARDDEAGIAHLERAMELDPEAVPQSAAALREYHWRKGQKEEAVRWHERMATGVDVLEEAGKERSRVLARDTFEPHDVPAATVARLSAELRQIPRLRRAFLVRKKVQHLPDRPCYVLGFGITPWYSFYRARRVKEALEQIQQSVTFPGETLILNAEGDNAHFARKFRRVAGARIV